MRVGIGGPPNSGKSTFAFALYTYLSRDSYNTVGKVPLDPID